MRQRRFANILGGAVVVAASAATMAVSASAAPSVAFRIAQGAVLDNGEPQRADVVAIAWPNQEFLEGLRDGDAVPMYVIGRSTTDASGRFAISSRPVAVPRQFRGEGGRVDVELAIAYDDREIRYGYTATPASDRWATASVAGRPAEVRVDFGRATAFEAGNDPAGWVDANGRPAGSPGRPALWSTRVAPLSEDVQQLLSIPLPTLRAQRLSSSVAPANSARVDGEVLRAIPCFTYAAQKHYGRPESFLRALGWAGAKATVYQNDGNDHTLGIGFRSSGGEWGASGTKTISLAASAERGGVVDAWAWNKINYRDYINSCAHTVQRRPYSVHSLLVKWTRAYHPVFKACARYTGGTYTKYRGTNTTYSSGTDIGPISVSAQSGWDRDTEIKWTVTRATRLCGSQRAGWVTSREAEAHRG